MARAFPLVPRCELPGMRRRPVGDYLASYRPGETALERAAAARFLRPFEDQFLGAARQRESG